MRIIKKNLYAFWLGGSLAISGIDVFNWRFYLVCVPVIILVGIFNNRESK